MKLTKRLLAAFVVGAVQALAGQCLLALWTLALAPTGDPALMSLISPLTMLSMGLLGGLLFLPRVFDKLEAIAGFGAFLPFSGFCVAIAHVVEGTRLGGAAAGKACGAGVKFVASTLGIGCAGCFLLGVAAFALQSGLEPFATLGSSLAATQAAAPALPALSAQMLLGAAVVGGILCVAFEAFIQYTKLPIPKVFILGLLLGGIFTAPGIMASLTAVGGAGADIMVIGAGSAVAATTVVLLSYGLFAPLLTVICLFLLLIAEGCVFGLLRAKRSPSASAAAGS
jgi:hypothetical protein